MKYLSVLSSRTTRARAWIIIKKKNCAAKVLRGIAPRNKRTFLTPKPSETCSHGIIRKKNAASPEAFSHFIQFFKTSHFRYMNRTEMKANYE